MKILTISLILILSGCANRIMHSDGYVVYPYSGTTEVTKIIALPFEGRKSSDAEVVQARATRLLPFFIVDFPFEVVADTVTLPYDTYNIIVK